MGVYDGELNYCPPTPNCASSQSWKFNPLHKISSYKYKEPKEESYQKLLNKFNSMENVKVMEAQENKYLRVYYFTKVFRFPDKVEFLWEEKEPLIQIRSASVFGIFDFFHNRVRLELIRKEFEWE
ncbi:MAG: DUF1499 domain-containing protein [Leptospiraceae bacterium]|nr:DUF1499 domain-containing protein [Leptospiraceae bacterium]